MNEIKTDALFTKIYSAATGMKPWESALQDICDGVDAWGAQLMAIDKRSGSVLFSHIAGPIPAEVHLDYVRSYHRIDPRTPMLLASNTEGWMHCHDLVNEAEVSKSPFYQDFLIPGGGRYVSGTKIVDDEELAVVLAVLRAWGQPPLQASELQWLDRCRTHMVEAMGIYRHLRAVHLERSLGHELLNAIRHPILLIDSSRGIRYSNPAARTALAERDYMFDRQGMLCLRGAEADTALATALSTLGLNQSDAQGAVRQSIGIRSTELGGTVGVSLSALRPPEVMGAFGPLPVGMLIFFDTRAGAETDPFVVSEVFDLTPSEAKVAVLLAKGASQEEIASERGVSINTVRSQVQRLLEKTDSSRQSELVRKVLTLTLAP